MKIFISWSGEQSKAIAVALKDFLPRVIQAVEPWLSESDIDKGSRWAQVLVGALDDVNFGICCLTKHNLEARWVLYEAGAIAKKVEGSYLWTYLHKLEHNDVGFPLAMFNHTQTTKDDTWKLMKTINAALAKAGEKPIKEDVLKDAYDHYWPEFEKKIQAAPDEKSEKPKSADEARRDLENKVDQILTILRDQTKPEMLQPLSGHVEFPESEQGLSASWHRSSPARTSALARWLRERPGDPRTSKDLRIARAVQEAIKVVDEQMRKEAGEPTGPGTGSAPAE